MTRRYLVETTFKRGGVEIEHITAWLAEDDAQVLAAATEGFAELREIGYDCTATVREDNP